MLPPAYTTLVIAVASVTTFATPTVLAGFDGAAAPLATALKVKLPFWSRNMYVSLEAV